MPCRSPLSGYRTPDGKIQFTDRKSSLGRFGFVTFRCGMCRDCRLYRAREWAIRAYHESQLRERNCFIDLTFAEEPHSISKRDLQLFFKRLRKSIPGVRIKYFAVGEYGEQFSRPHYHVCIFGWEPTDMVLWNKSPNGTLLFNSRHVDSVWKDYSPAHGWATISRLTAEAAGYAARYTMKKIGGDMAEEHYGGRVPEFNIASQGLGLNWITRFYNDVFRDGFCIFKGKKVPIPTYYRRWAEKNHPELYQKYLENVKDIYESLPPETGKRIYQAAQARDCKTQTLTRNLEAGRATESLSDDRAKSNRPFDRSTG